jgi:hypothetical protein
MPLALKPTDKLIETAYVQNHDYKTAFMSFYALCQQNINPNLSRNAVEEMLNLFTQSRIFLLVDTAARLKASSNRVPRPISFLLVTFLFYHWEVTLTLFYRVQTNSTLPHSLSR